MIYVTPFLNLVQRVFSNKVCRAYSMDINKDDRISNSTGLTSVRYYHELKALLSHDLSMFSSNVAIIMMVVIYIGGRRTNL